MRSKYTKNMIALIIAVCGIIVCLPAFAGSNIKTQKVYINADCLTTMRFRIVSATKSQTYAMLSPQDSITEAKVYNKNHYLVSILHVRELTKDTCIFEGAQYVYNPFLTE